MQKKTKTKRKMTETATCRRPKGDGVQTFQLVTGACLTARVSLPGNRWLPTKVPNPVLPGAAKPKGKAKSKPILKKPAASGLFCQGGGVVVCQIQFLCLNTHLGLRNHKDPYSTLRVSIALTHIALKPS